MLQLTAVVLFALSGLLQSLPCGQLEARTLQVSTGYQLVINGCPAEVAALGTVAELSAVLACKWQAQNHFLFLYGRLRGYHLVPLPAPTV